MKKALAILLAAIMIVGCAACTASSEPAKAVESAPPASGNEPATQEPAQPVTLTLWSIATESDAFHTPYVNAIADYEKAFGNVKIDFQTFENESYKPKLKAAIAANELPDIFYTWGGGFSKPFVEAGRVYAVDNAYENFKNDLPKTMLGNLTWDGKIYGASYILNVSMLFYNKKMFADNNLQAPKTYDELKAVCQAFIDKGITPLGISAREIWVLAQTHDALTLKSVGPSTLTSVLTKDGKNSYNSAGFIDASQKFVDLAKMGAYSKDAAALTNDEAMANFYAGKQPMYIMGSWMAGNILTHAANPADFGVVPVPVLDSKNVALTDYMGGPSDSLMVPASAKNPELAANVMFGIAKRLSQYGYLNGNGIPPWKVNYDDSAVAPLSKEVTAFVANATSFTLWFDTLMEAEDANIYLDNLQKLYLGDLDPTAFAQTVAAQLDKK